MNLHWQIVRFQLKETFAITYGNYTHRAALAPFCDYADLDGANLIANDIASGSEIVNGKINLSEDYGLGIKLN